ncbi:Protein TIFY 9 [Acorus calamus]|uniref:Protein TIFY 9 n=1 Tax=Acorus calamus TaxID=4465 RepID=A0AAV9C032_ACOCL|nr:Protein TIFY 9 [Acorus calamus]
MAVPTRSTHSPRQKPEEGPPKRMASASIRAQSSFSMPSFSSCVKLTRPSPPSSLAIPSLQFFASQTMTEAPIVHDFLGTERRSASRFRVREIPRSENGAVSIFDSPPQLPLCDPDSRRSVENFSGALTIIYNGTVSVFNVSNEMAEKILAAAESISDVSKRGCHQSQFERENLPMAQRRSLQRFFEKRKERLNCVSPYQTASTAGKDENVSLDLSLGIC